MILCLALILSGLSGCFTTAPQSGLYLHLLASPAYPTPPKLILSIPIHLSEKIDVPLAKGQYLRGEIHSDGQKFIAHLEGYFCSYTNVFDGQVKPEERFTPWGQPYDSNAPFVCQPLFMLSSNRNANAFVRQQNKAQRKEGERKPDREAEQHFKDTFLAKCNTNEIRCLWFHDRPNIGMEMTIHLNDCTVFEERECYSSFLCALQNGQSRKLSYRQLFSLRNIIDHLPPSDMKIASAKSVFISVRKGNKIKLFQYNRSHLPAAIQRIYDVAGGYLPDVTN
ncbi:MAG: hypothetical protein JWM68_123 [Verrucomicrobiales bacterium]|nr:hypothetical protein [Verrucomicrobiales bacterium]